MATAEIQSLLKAGLPQLGVQASPALVSRFELFLRLLEKWNRAFNLTAVRDVADMVPLHIFDSLTLRPFLRGTRIADIGTGAGLPGIPLALVESERRFVLVDSSDKKLRFVRQASAELGLNNVEAVQARAAQWQPAQPFETVVCRAFTSLAQFVAQCDHLVAPEGRLLAMKGRLPQTELGALPPGWHASQVAPVNLPGQDVHRHIVVLERRAVATRD